MHRLDPQSLPAYTDRLYRAAWGLCGSREEAEDLVQETFARVLARPRLVRGGSDLAYLLRGLRNTFAESLRTAERRPRTVGLLEHLTAAAPAGEQPEFAAHTQEVYAAIADLPEQFRLALVAVDVVGLSYAEAGQALDTREATVATRLFRARAEVAARFDLAEGAATRGPQGVVGDDQSVKPRASTNVKETTGSSQ
ncbi:MAG: RNA polymerase sigma factor [Solirubrobacterales bacterium]